MTTIVKREADLVVEVVDTVVVAWVTIKLPMGQMLPFPLAKRVPSGLRAEEALAQLLEQLAAKLREESYFASSMTAADIGPPT